MAAEYSAADRRLLALGCAHDPTTTGYDRWTHLLSGRAVIRWRFYSPEVWEARKQAFCAFIEAANANDWKGEE